MKFILHTSSRCQALKIFACFLLAGVMLFSSVSCTMQVSAEELSGSYQRKATEAGEVTEDLKQAMADFSFNLFHRTVVKDSENDLLSPLSAYLCLAMLANGADGETRSQMDQILGLSADERNKGLYAYVSGLYSGKNCKADLANSIWFRNEENRLHVREEFLQTNADWFGADVYAAPFDGSTLSDINNWTKKNTDGLIDKMLEEIPDDAVMYLINTLLFDAKWQNTYEKNDIHPTNFKNYDGTSSEVQMMYSDEAVYLTGQLGDVSAKGFARNYEGGKYSFVALLPESPEGETPCDVYALTEGLNGEGWLQMWENRQMTSVNVGIPEFSYGSHLKLNDPLTDMGMTDAFDGNKANLDSLGWSERGNLRVSLVEQKNIIEVSRNGTKAAAITWAELTGESCAVSFYSVYLDRPFVYAIVDNATGLPLFLGLVSHL